MGDSMTSRASFSESTPTFAAVVGFVVVEVSSVGSVVEVIEVEAIASIVEVEVIGFAEKEGVGSIAEVVVILVKEVGLL